jgi:hypothetical protein
MNVNASEIRPVTRSVILKRATFTAVYTVPTLEQHSSCARFVFCRDIYDICTLLGHYAELSCSFLYRRFGTIYRFHLKGAKRPSRKPQEATLSSWVSWPLKRGPIDCPETSVQNCHSTLHNVSEDRRIPVLQLSMLRLDSWSERCVQLHIHTRYSYIDFAFW